MYNNKKRDETRLLLNSDEGFYVFWVVSIYLLHLILNITVRTSVVETG